MSQPGSEREQQVARRLLLFRGGFVDPPRLQLVLFPCLADEDGHSDHPFSGRFEHHVLSTAEVDAACEAELVRIRWVGNEDGEIPALCDIQGLGFVAEAEAIECIRVHAVLHLDLGAVQAFHGGLGKGFSFAEVATTVDLPVIAILGQDAQERALTDFGQTVVSIRQARTQTHRNRTNRSSNHGTLLRKSSSPPLTPSTPCERINEETDVSLSSSLNGVMDRVFRGRNDNEKDPMIIIQ